MGRQRGWRGERENADILEAASQQGWEIGRTTNHIRLTPPDPNKPMVVTANTSSDRRNRRNFLSDLRRSGLIWPPPQKNENGKESKMDTSVTPLTLKTALEERKIKELAIDSLDLTIRTYNVLRREGILTVGAITSHTSEELLCLQGFREQCLGEIKVKLFELGLELKPELKPEPAREEKVATIGEIKVATIGEIVGETAIRDFVTQSQHWAPVAYPTIIKAGYRVSREGEMKTPTGRILTPNLQGQHVYVTFGANNSSGNTSRRLDKVMLESFRGPAPDPDMVPVHINEDTLDCSLKNLEWGARTYSPRGGKKDNGQQQQESSVLVPERPYSGPLDVVVTMDDEVQVSTVISYRYHGIEVIVGEDGKPQVPEVTLANAADLGKILARIGEGR